MAEPENLCHDSLNWLSVKSRRGPERMKDKKPIFDCDKQITVGFLVQYQQIAAGARRKCTEGRLIFSQKKLHERRGRKYLGKYVRNYHREIPFYSFSLCDEDGDDDDDDVFIGFTMRETLLCV